MKTFRHLIVIAMRRPSERVATVLNYETRGDNLTKRLQNRISSQP